MTIQLLNYTQGNNYILLKDYRELNLVRALDEDTIVFSLFTNPDIHYIPYNYCIQTVKVKGQVTVDAPIEICNCFKEVNILYTHNRQTYLQRKQIYLNKNR